MKFINDFRQYRQLLAGISIGLGIFFSSMAGYQISYAQDIFDLAKACITLKKECSNSQIERIELLTLMWDGTLKYQLLLCCLFYFLSGVFWFKKRSINDE